MFCNNCGKQIDDKAAVCIHCGVATHETVQQPQQAQESCICVPWVYSVLVGLLT